MITTTLNSKKCIIMTLGDESTWTLLTTQKAAQAQRTISTIARIHDAKCLPGIPLNLWLSREQNQEVFEWEDATIGIYVQSDKYDALKDLFGEESSEGQN